MYLYSVVRYFTEQQYVTSPSLSSLLLLLQSASEKPADHILVVVTTRSYGCNAKVNHYSYQQADCAKRREYPRSCAIRPGERLNSECRKRKCRQQGSWAEQNPLRQNKVACAPAEEDWQCRAKEQASERGCSYGAAMKHRRDRDLTWPRRFCVHLRRASDRVPAWPAALGLLQNRGRPWRGGGQSSISQTPIDVKSPIQNPTNTTPAMPSIGLTKTPPATLRPAAPFQGTPTGLLVAPKLRPSEC